MEPTKSQIARDRSVSSQEAIVKQLVSQTTKPKRLIIPGGRTMLKEFSVEQLEDAMFNWLRACRYFTGVSVSLIKDASGYKTSEIKVVDYDDTGKQPIWVSHTEGKRFLARGLSQALFSNKCLGVRADKTGVFVIKDTEDKFTYDPKDDNWQPVVVFTPERKSEYR